MAREDDKFNALGCHHGQNCPQCLKGNKNDQSASPAEKQIPILVPVLSSGNDAKLHYELDLLSEAAGEGLDKRLARLEISHPCGLETTIPWPGRSSFFYWPDEAIGP